jgi:hypothetical protein
LIVFLKALFFIQAPRSSFLPESILIGRIWLIIVLAVASTSLPKNVSTYIYERFPKLRFSEPVFAFACIFASFLMLLGQTYNPFLYFRI